MRLLVWSLLAVGALTAGLLALKPSFAGSVGRRVGALLPLPGELADLDPEVAELVGAARAAVVREPRRAQAWGELGWVYDANELLDLSPPCYRAAADLDPKNPRWPYGEAIAQSRRGRTAEAIEALHRAIEIDPRLARARWRLGLLLLDRGEFQSAVSAFRSAIELDPDDVSGWLGLARALLQQDDFEGAIEACRRALAPRPGNRYAHLLLGTALLRAGRIREARVELERGQGSHPTWPDPWELDVLRRRVGANAKLREAQAYLKQGQSEEAIAMLERLCRAHPKDISAGNTLALAYRDAGRLAQARGTLEALLEFEPASPGTHLNLAGVLAAQDRLEGALAEVDRALAFDPRSGSARELRGVLLRRLSRREEAIEAFHWALEVDQRNPHVSVWLAELLAEQEPCAGPKLEPRETREPR